MSAPLEAPSRRDVLAAGAAALLACLRLPHPAAAQTAGSVDLGHYLRIAPDGVVFVLPPAAEMGQETRTAQVRIMEGSVVDALGAALGLGVEIEHGRAGARNVDGWQILRLDEAPRVETASVHTGAPLGGAGESGAPPLAPALAAAAFRATGRRVRTLPPLRAGLA